MFRKIASFTLFFIYALFYCEAIDLAAPQSLLGSGIDNLFQSESVPDEIFPNRGVEADEDNVVFFYDIGVYLFLYNNRVWQVRYDRTYTGEFLDLKMGLSRSEILFHFLKTNQVPISTGGDFITFQLSDAPYPVRMKLYFSEDILEDFYIYRADF